MLSLEFTIAFLDETGSPKRATCRDVIRSAEPRSNRIYNINEQAVYPRDVSLPRVPPLPEKDPVETKTVSELEDLGE